MFALWHIKMAFVNRIEVPATCTDINRLQRGSGSGQRVVRSSTLFDCLEMIGASGDRIFNLDETGVTTVQKVTKLVATKGIKQLGQITSREHVELMTVSSFGQTLSPAFVFPRKNFIN